MKLPDVQFHLDTGAGNYATAVPSAPTTKAPASALVCNTGTNTFQCMICGEGQPPLPPRSSCATICALRRRAGALVMAHSARWPLGAVINDFVAKLFKGFDRLCLGERRCRDAKVNGLAKGLTKLCTGLVDEIVAQR